MTTGLTVTEAAHVGVEAGQNTERRRGAFTVEMDDRLRFECCASSTFRLENRSEKMWMTRPASWPTRSVAGGHQTLSMAFPDRVEFIPPAILDPHRKPLINPLRPPPAVRCDLVKP
jgi:hypothetical protein